MSAMEDNLITQNPQNNSVSDVDNSQSEAIEQKTAKLLELEPHQESVDAQAEPEITRDQLALSKRLLNWRTFVPLIIVIVAIVFFVQKEDDSDNNYN